ncbi:efflux RND transporter periplasmic adaptor subunit [Vibrio tapetis]|uniref:Putative periplasmic linker protein n=1 Tax=Vibrio tapetis subsp. tapetis TaxID=1671868 RepID=A0A2N8Z9Y5_9VIBR|nr:efflux RND transporter periplasmic adaptor subunit [Vibrio tapetis]SON48697.1 putative periplasmic linker protein [Vibrio tapetis subsp. tapetis]
MKYGLLAASLSALLLTQGCTTEDVKQSAMPLSVSTVTVSAPIETQHRSFKGQVMPAERTPLSFRIEGELVSRLVIEGQQVKRGDVLAKLDDKKLRQKLSDAKAQFALAKKQLSRGEEMFVRQMVSDAELDELTANMRLAQANFQAEQQKMKYSVLTAPFDGVISALDKEQFESVNPGETVVSMYQNDQVYVQIQLSDTVLAMLNPDRNQSNYKPMASFSGLSETYTLTYLEHTSEPSPQSQTYEMWLRMPQVTPAILPGTSVNVEVDLLAAGLRTQTGYQVPMPVLQAGDENGQFYVWKWSEGEVHRKEVKVEFINSEGAIIANGSAQGDVLVSSSLRKLREGQSVVKAEGNH